MPVIFMCLHRACLLHQSLLNSNLHQVCHVACSHSDRAQDVCEAMTACSAKCKCATSPCNMRSSSRKGGASRVVHGVPLQYVVGLCCADPHVEAATKQFAGPGHGVFSVCQLPSGHSELAGCGGLPCMFYCTNCIFSPANARRG